MDPISVSASIITLLAAASSCCNFVHKVIINVADAPHDIRIHIKKLECLQGTLTCLVEIHPRLPPGFELAENLRDGIKEFAQDMCSLHMRVQAKIHSMEHGKGRRIRESCTWLFDRHMRRSLDSLDHWHIILSQAASAAQM